MTSERAEQGATPDNHQREPGATLAAQREALGWSVEQVAEQLKLAVRQVVAIEKGDFASLPSPAVTRGFVRAYAKILRVDPAPLVAMIPMDNPLPAETGAPVRRERSFSHSRYPTHGKRSNLPLAWIAGVAVVALAGAAVWHFGLVSLPGSTTGNTTGSGAGNGELLHPPLETVPGSHLGGETGHNPSVPLISVPAPAPAGGAAAPAGNAAPGPAAPGSATPPAAAAPAAVPPATLAPAAAVPAVAPAPGANTLVLTVREDSWIEVRPQGGKALVSRLVKAGSTETVEIPGASTLVVGNPAGVSATLRGAELALPPVPGKTVSRVALK
ncbi:helix-turn-helix domain-containing protein [Massilia sp. GCM10023247]|uniref:helix-turn-helix domain-containing protein n=1 Tax=Massilia sp. GCM10023247 TaxID=3252643 RepID=UPI003610C6F9